MAEVVSIRRGSTIIEEANDKISAVLEVSKEPEHMDNCKDIEEGEMLVDREQNDMREDEVNSNSNNEDMEDKLVQTLVHNKFQALDYEMDEVEKDEDLEEDIKKCTYRRSRRGNSPTIKRLKRLNRIQECQALVIIEPKIQSHRVEKVKRGLKMDKSMANRTGDIWFLCKDFFNINLLVDSGQHLTMEIFCEEWDLAVVISLVHTKCTKKERQELWSSLLQVMPNTTAWMIALVTSSGP
ncbi:uncharacterized protein A4U43_C07F36840 [Asparagus officinalis]|uniref:Uncharacterized protein n=1 Tax=Asparagus officinalis TaxID=4686 RepID=A0A5P1EI37_ASPOF|nr:uncharacterized protein A4U43_C07F36840 [Asparagus officinalis]